MVSASNPAAKQRAIVFKIRISRTQVARANTTHVLRDRAMSIVFDGSAVFSAEQFPDVLREGAQDAVAFANRDMLA